MILFTQPKLPNGRRWIGMRGARVLGPNLLGALWFEATARSQVVGVTGRRLQWQRISSETAICAEGVHGITQGIHRVAR